MRKSTLAWLCMMAVLWPAASAWSALDGWVSFGNGNQHESPKVVLTNVGDDSVDLKISLSGAVLAELGTREGLFTELRIPESGILSEIGSPKLPAVRRLVEVPYGAEISLEIVSANSSIHQIGALGITRPVMPVQAPVPKVPGALESAPFAIDDDVYGSAALYPAVTARLGEVSNIRGHRIVQVEFFPIQYSPSLGVMNVTTEAVLRVRYSNGDTDRTRTNIARLWSDRFDGWITGKILNHESFSAPASKGRSDDGMLVIVDDSLEASTAGFVAWKEAIGFDVTVANTSTAGSTTTAIKAYIQNAYDTWTSPPLTFVVLVGDEGAIPTFTGDDSSTEADLYYTTLDGTDWLPDVFIGRISAQTPAQATTYFDRAIGYEQAAFADQEWLKKAAYVGTCDSGWYQVGEGTHDYCIDNFMDPNGWTSDRLYCISYSATTQQVIDALEDGRNLCVYSGHGSDYSWAAPSGGFDQADVSSLSLGDMTPFVTSHACVTATFANSECYGETWMRDSAIGFWGASANTYWDEDDILQKGMFHGLFDDGHNALGQMTDDGLFYVHDYYGGAGRTRYYFEAYTVLGDPSLGLWTEEPHAGHISLDSAKYPLPGLATVTVTDADLDLDPGSIDTVDVELTSTTEATPEILTLVESGNSTKLFTGSIAIVEGAPSRADGQLQAAEGDTITAAYLDEDDGTGNPNLVVAEAVVDATSPVISSVSVIDISDAAATVTWATDEAANSTVRYGTTLPPTIDVSDGASGTAHSVNLTGLAESTRYYFEVASADAAGNGATDDNGGLYYTFITDTFMEVFSDDMEGGEGTWTHSGGGDEWELGEPTFVDGPSGCHSGTNCWGTDLDNTYENSADYSLYTGEFELFADSRLLFWHWYDFESCCDQGIVEISDDGGANWTNITPGGEYNGTSGWTLVEIDLAGYAGHAEIRFNVTSDSSVVDAGWYIDDIMIGRLVSSGVYHYEEVYDDGAPGGDGDGTVEPGEGADVAVTVVNTSDGPALGVVGVLSTTDPYVTVLQDTVLYGDIASGDTAAGAGVFEVLVDGSCPVGHSVSFSLEVSATGDGPWWDAFTMYVTSVNTISGVVRDLASAVGIEGATVAYTGAMDGDVLTGTGGVYEIAGLDAGAYALTAAAAGYAPGEAAIVLPPDASGVDFDLGAPVIDVNPDEIIVTLAPGGTDERTMNVENNGNVDLTFSIVEEETKGAGGPDAFGYRWKDSDEPGGPVYDWVEVSVIGTQITGLGDDSNVGPFDIGFDFPYYDATYSSFRLCSNGWISFASTTTTYSNTGLPSTSAPLNMIAPFWDDLTFSSSGTAYYWSDGDKLVIQYDSVPHYSAGGPYTFEIILESNGRITLQYESLSTPLNEATVGIQNAAGTDGLQIAYNAAYLHNEMAIRIASDVAWLEVDPGEGVAGVLGFVPVTVGFDATGLSAGTYKADLVISSNDPVDPEVVVPVTLNVSDCEDVDEDGYPAEWCGGDDCDDADADVNPGVDEGPSGDPLCADGIDNDCDGLADLADPGCEAACTDLDEDGFAVEGGECGAIDCDDANPEVNPGHAEVPDNGIDDDCDGQVDEPCFIGISLT